MPVASPELSLSLLTAFSHMPILWAVLIAALLFDFVNGFHDAANAIATIIATRTLKAWQAVLWSASFNFLALFFVSGAVAGTVGTGLIDLQLVTPGVILCGLLGATSWSLFTWWRGLPSSSSHALLGAYAGAAFLHVAWTGLPLAALYHVGLWLKVLAFIVLAPAIGYALARLLALGARRLPQQHSGYRWLQLGSSALLSFNHGANDAQKTAGIIAGALALGSAGVGEAMPAFTVPLWVLVVSFVTMALGTLAGGWRIVKTLGFRLAKLTPLSGSCAEMGAALSIALATALGLPVSSTLATTGAIAGVGATQAGQTKYPLLRRIALAWLLTLPGAFIIGVLLQLLGEQL